MFNIGINNFKLWVLTASAIIVGVESQVTCDSSSADCCWVVRSWQLLEGETESGVDPMIHINSTVGNCGLVRVSSEGSSVIEIDWFLRALDGPIPTELGNLKSLRRL